MNAFRGSTSKISFRVRQIIYVSNTADLGGFASQTQPNGCYTTNNIQCIVTPYPIPGNDPSQGYWSSPAYWYFTSGSAAYNWLYYSADAPNTVGQGGGPGQSGVAPMPINAYQLASSGSSGPIPSSPTATSTTLFCAHSPTPSVSSNGTTNPLSGIVWAIEVNQNKDNPAKDDCAGAQYTGLPAALHAFCATAGGAVCPSAMTEVYSSRGLSTAAGHASGFPTPTVFNGQVFVGTDTFVDVFGMCPAPPGSCKN